PLALATTAAIYGQLIVGAVMRHTGAGLAIPTFPLDPAGRLLPPLDDPAVRIHFLHRLGALLVTLLVVGAVSRALAAGGAWLRRPRAQPGPRARPRRQDAAHVRAPDRPGPDRALGRAGVRRRPGGQRPRPARARGRPGGGSGHRDDRPAVRLRLHPAEAPLGAV